MLENQTVGESLVGGSAILGVGALCYYGAGLGSQAGAIDTAQFWPAFARERVSSTFTAFGAGIAMTAAQAYAIYQSGFAARMMRMSPWVVLGGTLVACIGSQVLVHSVSYENKFLKFCAYSLFTGCTAAMISPIVGLGGAIVYKAAAYTSVVVGSMCAVAACAPSDKFLYMGGPLACGLGIVVCASFGGMFFPANAMLHSISMYGGLVLFSGFVLYDVQKFVHKAQIRQYYYDPVNECIGIYLDTVNIFIRIASILGNQKNK
eukprot:GSMAST32.ASY1.ANO1.2305.1 assembled CDS